jgi:ribose transport system substrate-binding protein
MEEIMKPLAMRLFCLLTVLLTLSFLCSCEKRFHKENERYVMVAANIALPYWQEVQAGFKDSAKALGVKVEVKGPDTYSPDLELQVFQKAVEQRVSGILISAARPDLFRGPIDEAVKSGIPVICVDSDVPDSKRILFIGTDNYQAGLESGRRIAEAMHGKGQLIVVTTPGQQNLDERLRGVEEALKKYPGIKISETLDDKGDSGKANDQISALLDKKEKIDGVVCLEASGGPGVGSAFHRLDLGGKIPIVAMDRNPETLDLIQEGVITATVAQKPYTMGFYGLKFLDDLHHNIVREFKDWKTAPASPLPTRVDTGTAIIDKSNLADFRAAAVARANESSAE